MLRLTFLRIFDYMILSFAAAGVLSLGYTFTAATMVILYGTVYAMLID